MPQARGSQLVVGLYDETTYATDPGTPTGTLLHVDSCGLSAKSGLSDNEVLHSSRTVTKPARGKIDVSGALPGKIYPEAFAKLLKHTLGSVATSGAGPYTHVITIGASLPVGMLIERDNGSNLSGSGRYEKFNGCRVADASFTFPQEGWPTASLNLRGAKRVAAAAPLDATYDDLGYSPFHSFEATVQEGGGALAIATAIDFKLMNGLDENGYAIGTRERRNLHEGRTMVTGTLTAMFEDQTLLDKAINSTESSLKITLTRGTGLGSAGNESIEFFLQNLMYELDSPAVEGPQGILVKLPFKVYRSGANLGLQATVKNAIATL